MKLRFSIYGWLEATIGVLHLRCLHGLAEWE